MINALARVTCLQDAKYTDVLIQQAVARATHSYNEE